MAELHKILFSKFRFTPLAEVYVVFMVWQSVTLL